jgi:hypothetical protein
VPSLFARRSLRRRIVALAAAYVIALGGLFASRVGADMAAAAIGSGSSPITCHGDAAGTPSPAQNDKNGNACIDCCCVGCAMLMAALPAPPIKAIGAPQSAARLLALPALAAVPGASPTRSHQSRAPPLRA